MNYTAIINLLQLIILNDPTPPAVGSQEFLQYSGLIGPIGIGTWENERGVLWRELIEPLVNAFTLAAGAPSVNTFSLPSDFKFMYDSQITLTYTSGSQLTFKVKQSAEAEFNPYNQIKEFYVFGNPSAGYTLVPGWTVNAGDPEVGATLSFRYYKTAIQPTLDSTGNITSLNDVPEMSDPRYIVYTVAAQIQGGNYNTAQQVSMENKAAYYMTQMRNANEMPSNYQDNYVKDIDHLLRHQGRYRNAHISPDGSYGN